MYKAICGHYGLDPAYFFGSLGLQEANEYIEGAREREIGDWERARLLANITCKVQTGQDLNLVFPWERPSDEEIAEQTAEAMKAAKVMEEMVKRGELKI